MSLQTAELLLVDVPIVLVLARIGQWPQLFEQLGVAPVVSLHAQAEIREAWAADVAGADLVDAEGLTVQPPAPADDIEALTRAGQHWRALGAGWRQGSEGPTRSISLAGAVVAAINHGIPLLSHDFRAWDLVKNPNRARRLTLVGLADVFGLACQRGVTGTDQAWSWYETAVGLGAGQQPTWPVGERARFEALLGTRP